MHLVVDGRRVFATTGGQPFDPDRSALIFVHGAGMDHSVWALQTRWFAWRGRSVLAVDLPGHGRSEGPPLPTIADQGIWLLQLLESSGAPSAALVGHSMGALAALAATAAADPGTVSRLALLGAGAKMPVHPDLLDAARAGESTAWDLIVSWGYGQPAHFGTNPAPGLWMQGGGRSLLARGQDGVLATDLAACDGYRDAAEAMRRVGCPVLFVVGDSDRMTPPHTAAELASHAETASIVTIRDAGHMMMVEKPDQTLDALISAL